MQRRKLSLALTAAAVVATALVTTRPVLGGSIAGTVKVTATGFPAPAPLTMDADPQCLAKHGAPPASELVVVDADGRVGNVFVYVKSGLDPGARFRAPQAPAVLDQKGCVFTPRVFGLMLGQPLKVLNSDGLLHNVHLVPQINREINKAMPAFRRQMTLPPKLFTQPEVMIPIKCDAHPWMAAYVGVLPHPFFAVTATDGSFEIDGVPPGRYTVEAWHEFFDNQAREIEVGDAAVRVGFALSTPASR